MAEYSVIGKSIPRVDAVDKVTGKIKYTTDFHESFLSAKVLRSPHPHAKIISIDTSRAEAYPGVRGVVTPKDAPNKHTGYVLCPDRYVLPVDNTVRYVGEPVAVVAADTEDIAEEALELIDVKYEILPAIFDPEKSIEPGCNVIIHPDKLNYAPPGIHLMGTVMERDIPNGCGRFRIRKGDVDKAFKEADLIVENRYSFDGGSHARIEPFNIEAWVEDGVMTVRCNRMRMHACQGWLANLFGVAPNKVRMLVPAVGGNFGGKGTIVSESLALMAALKTGRRVRLSYTREEEFVDTNPRPTLIVYIKDGFK
jgi:CO/xanthine dehydrogenase Mo-binding subunit